MTQHRVTQHGVTSTTQHEQEFAMRETTVEPEPTTEPTPNPQPEPDPDPEDEK